MSSSGGECTDSLLDLLKFLYGGAASGEMRRFLLYGVSRVLEYTGVWPVDDIVILWFRSNKGRRGDFRTPTDKLETIRSPESRSIQYHVCQSSADWILQVLDETLIMRYMLYPGTDPTPDIQHSRDKRVTSLSGWRKSRRCNCGNLAVRWCSANGCSA